jgi:hypothetical protein
MAEAAHQQVLCRQASRPVRIRRHLAQSGERIIRTELILGQVQGNRGQAGRKDGAGDLRRLDAGYDAGAAPRPHLRQHLGEIARRDVKAPRPVQSAVAHDAAQQGTPIPTGGFDQ